MKLIVDIPDNWEKELNQSKITFADVVDIDTIRNGIPLDKIRAEIERERSFQRVMEEYDIATGLRKALEIIDKYKV